MSSFQTFSHCATFPRVAQNININNPTAHASTHFRNIQQRRMREKMAELQFEAPLAQFDGDEWNEFNDYQTTEDIENSNKVLTRVMESEDRGNVDNFNDSSFSGSLEDLVSTFDEKISKCFCNNESVEKMAPVQVRSQDEIMEDCQMWWTITGNFGNILPIDWGKSYARQLQENALNLADKREQDPSDLDLSDDEELKEAFDMHSLIISSLQDEPMFTADDVINEIDSMMEEGSDTLDTMSTPGSDIMSTTSSELLQFRERHFTSGMSLEEGLKSLSVSALNELLEELEVTIKDHSEVLIAELALRDELEYEKELKNQFMSLLVTVQQKRKDFQTDRKKNLNVKRNVPTGTTEPGTYLTTVIPYHAGQGAPTIEQMQIYIKILRAINEDSSTVPGLLTDYILKVLCPTT